MSRSRLRSLVAFGVLTGPLLLGALLTVDARSARLFGVAGPTCPIGGWIGESCCPGCGLTRSTAMVVQGEWASAIAINPVGPIVVLACLLGLLVHGHVMWTGRRAPAHETLLRRGRQVFAVAVLGGWFSKVGLIGVAPH